MKKFLWIIAAALPIFFSCQKELSVAERAFLALPGDVFESISSPIADASVRETLVKADTLVLGSNEDSQFFRLSYSEDAADELNVCCFQGSVFCDINLHTYKMEGEDMWFILYDFAEKVDEDTPMKSILTKGFRFDTKKNTLEEAGIQSEPYSNQDFFDPIVSWPYIKSGEEVLSTHTVMMNFGYYICPNFSEEADVQEDANTIPFALKYVWDGQSFKKAGRGPAFGFVDNLAAFSVVNQNRIPYDFEFPGCRMVMSSEAGYNNVPIRHFDVYEGDEHLVRLDPFPAMCDEEGRFILMQITSYSPRYKTPEGFGVGSLMKEILESPSYYNMDATAFIRGEETLEDGRKAVSIRFEGFEAETLFITDAPEISSEGATVSEVLIRPIAQG